MLDDLLDVTRIAQDRICLQKSPMDLRDVAAEAVLAVRGQSQAADVNIQFDAGTDPLPVFGDSCRLQQMVVNLLMNAIKYTPSGGNVWLKLSSEGDHVTLRVKDTGVGIRPEMLEKVFDLFVQANETLHRSEGGMGVGLALVRTIAELHGGSVRAMSDGPGKGSEFVVGLPRSYAVPASEKALPQAHRVRRPWRCPDRRGQCRQPANARGESQTRRLYRPHRGRRQGGARSDQEPRPDLAIIDIGLPELDGYRLAERFAEAWGSDTFLIALTGYGRPEDRRAVQEVASMPTWSNRSSRKNWCVLTLKGRRRARKRKRRPGQPLSFTLSAVLACALIMRQGINQLEGIDRLGEPSVQAVRACA